MASEHEFIRDKHKLAFIEWFTISFNVDEKGATVKLIRVLLGTRSLNSSEIEEPIPDPVPPDNECNKKKFA